MPVQNRAAVQKNKHHREGHKQNSDGNQRQQKSEPRPIEPPNVIIRAAPRPAIPAAPEPGRMHTATTLPSPRPVTFNRNWRRNYRHTSPVQLDPYYWREPIAS
jgi:hypothetical protein